MKKTKSSIKFLKATLCASAFCAVAFSASVAPAYSAGFDGINPANVQQQLMLESGRTYKHDIDSLNQQRYKQEYSNGYQQYERNRYNPQSNQVVDDYNPDASFMQGQVQDIDSNGVYVSSVEVAPSEILSQEEINNIVRPLIGRNVFIKDITEAVNKINNLYASKGFVTARAFLPAQTVSNGHVYIDLVESKVGNITVKENRYTRSKYITDRLPQKQGDLFDIVELEKDILDFNSYNEGVNLTAKLLAGQAAGTTDIAFTA